MEPSAWRSRKRKPLLDSGADDLDGDGTMNSGRSPLSSGPTYDSATPRYWRTARTDDVAVPLQTRGTSTPRPVVSVLLWGRCRGFAWGHEAEVATKRESVPRPRGGEFAESEKRAHSCGQDGVDAAFGEPAEIKGRAQLRYDAVGNGQSRMARGDSVVGAFAVRPLEL